MNDIFISYHHEDRLWARKLAQTLEERGWSVFWDQTTPIGKQWRERLAQELSGAHCVIVLWSKTSIGSDWVLDEADDAKRRGILVPIKIENVELALGFRGIETADLADWNMAELTPTANRLFTGIAARIESAPMSVSPLSPLRRLADRNLIALVAHIEMGTMYKSIFFDETAIYSMSTLRRLDSEQLSGAVRHIFRDIRLINEYAESNDLTDPSLLRTLLNNSDAEGRLSSDYYAFGEMQISARRVIEQRSDENRDNFLATYENFINVSRRDNTTLIKLCLQKYNELL